MHRYTPVKKKIINKYSILNAVYIVYSVGWELRSALRRYSSFKLAGLDNLAS